MQVVDFEGNVMQKGDKVIGIVNSFCFVIGNIYGEYQVEKFLCNGMVKIKQNNSVWIVAPSCLKIVKEEK